MSPDMFDPCKWAERDVAILKVRLKRTKRGHGVGWGGAGFELEFVF